MSCLKKDGRTGLYDTESFGCSALLALLNNEEGAKMVANELEYASICAVNLAEVIGKLLESGMPENAAQQAIDPLGLKIIDFTSRWRMKPVD